MPNIEDLVRDLGGVAAAAAPASLPPPFPVGHTQAPPPEPNERAKDGSTPCIHLAGKYWPIPLLAPRQNRVVVPAVSKVTKRMREIAEAKLGNLDADDKAALIEALGSDSALRKRIWQITDFSFELAHELEPAFYDNVADAVFWALTRAHPQLTRAQFDEMPIGTLELIDAIGTVAQQTGMMKRGDPSAAPLADPEPRAAAAPSPSSQTGTP